MAGHEAVFTFGECEFRVPLEAVELLAGKLESELALELENAVASGQPVELSEAHAHAVGVAIESLVDDDPRRDVHSLHALQRGLDEQLRQA